MAHHKSAIIRIRRNARHEAINTSRMSRLRTSVRKVEEAIAGGDQAAAVAAFKNAQPELQRTAGRRLIHPNAASRKISRLSARIKAMSARA
ncbi:MAG: 30S ribosomal protein S20 [Alphaproteobacteria bacterium]|nr:30S ribosomal protein S20 [Alphaproteobacteria bacterium]